MMIPDFVDSAQPPWLYICAADVSRLTDLSWSISRQCGARLSVRFVRGKKMCKRAALFNEFAAALQFPDYFGDNLDAFDECITDLEWLNARGYLIVILNADEVLADTTDPDSDFRVFVDQLNSAALQWSKPIKQGEAWDRDARPFHVIFHVEHGQMASFRLRLERIGIELPKVTVE